MIEGTNTFIILFAYIILIMLIGFVINLMASRIVRFGFIYRILVSPGVIIHELAHAFGCVLMGAKIQSINVFKREGGEVAHTGSPIPIVGNVVISLMPVAVGVAILYLLSKLPHGMNLSDLSNWTNWSNYLTWQFWAFLYLIFNLVATMAPSKQDIKVIWWDLLVLAGILFLLTKVGVIINIAVFLPFLILSLVYSTIIFIIVGIIYLVLRII